MFIIFDLVKEYVEEFKSIYNFWLSLVNIS